MDSELYFTEDVNILDSRITSIQFTSKDYGCDVEIKFQLVYPRGHWMKICLKNIKEYSLFWNSRNIFYNIERYKFLKLDHYMYLCLDPTDENDEINSEDNDYIIFENIESFISSDDIEYHLYVPNEDYSR